MKKVCLVAALLSMMFMPVMAKNVEVEALSDFSTDNPPRVFSVRLMEPVVSGSRQVKAGSILEGKITVKDAARLKRDASFTFIPVKLTEPDGTVTYVKRHFSGKYSKGFDKGKIAKSAVLGAGNLMIKGFSTGYTALEGAVKNEEGNRLKSSAVAVYENSPLSYVEKGDALVIKQGDNFYINFKED